MRGRFASFFRIHSQFDEVFWAIALVAGLWVLQQISIILHINEALN